MNIRERIQAGIDGKFEGLDNGFNRINKYIFGIQKGVYYLLGGASGTFKTTLTDFVILNALADAKRKGRKINIFYYSFEIDELSKQCNWLSVLAYKKYNREIPSEKIKGFRQTGQTDLELTQEEQQMVISCIPDLEELFSQIHFEFIPTNPTGIFNQLIKFFQTRGKLTYTQYTDLEGNVHNKIDKYIPDDPDEITIGICDHIIKIKSEREAQGWSKKQVIDKYSEYCVQLRNLYGMSWWNVSQFNRSLSSTDRQKFKGIDLSPEASDFKETGAPYEDADVVLSTMNPYKLDIEKCLGYDINKLKQNFIQLKIIKNRLSTDNIGIGVWASPKSGSFKELEPCTTINYSNYINL